MRTLREKEEVEEEEKPRFTSRIEKSLPAPSLLLPLPRKRFSIFFIYHLCIIVINVTRETEQRYRYTSIRNDTLTDAIKSY